MRKLNGNAWDFTQSEMLEAVADRDVWRLNLELVTCFPRNTHGHEWALKAEKESATSLTHMHNI